jgi:uncharacterized membrane protein
VTAEPQRQPPRRRVIERGDEEFSRVLAFSDGLFAIAMTLLVVGIEVPELGKPSERELWDALTDLQPAYVTIYLAFVAFLPFPTALLGTYFENPHPDEYL